jgi:peptide/nickel transport system permease protein
MAAFGVLMSGALFRIVRAATLAVSEETYIEAAKLSGMRDGAIISRHLVARVGPVLIVQTSVVLSLALVNLIGLGVLGLGSRPPAPSWGSSLQEAGSSIFIAPWMLGPPAAIVALTILSLLILGDFFQDRETARIGRGSVITPNIRRLEPLKPKSDALAEDVVLSVRNLSVGIASVSTPVWLIDDVSFLVRAGETVGLVGESGAGKSVAARTALGLFPANSIIRGSVELLGQELTTADTRVLNRVRGRQAGFIAQQPMTAIDPAFTVGQLLTEAVRTLKGESKAEASKSVLQLLRDVQIRDPERVVKLYPHEISGGMAQRVGIALSLVGNPQLLIADEPTTALDVTVQREVLTLLRRLQKERGLALLLVTHDWGVVADMCDRVVVFYAGQVVEAAGVDDIFERPRHPYSIALRRADPHAQEPGSQLKVIDGQVPPPGAWPVGCHFQTRCAEAGPECREAAVELVEKNGRAVRCVHASSPEVRS